MAERFNPSRSQVEENLKALFVLSQDGNQEAYGSFLALSSALIKKYLSHLGGKYETQQNLEDLLQEILLSIHQKKHTFQLDKPILPWLYAVARYRFIDFYRAKKRGPQMSEFKDELATEISENFSLDLEEIFAILTPKQREMVTMVKLDGSTYSEAASALGMSVPSVKVGVHRVLKSLKDRIIK